jgi:protein-S-isoprenylcysteine O-methyltransferase Ste14
MLFLISVLGMIAAVPIHFFSVEHSRLEEKYGQEKGKKLGAILGMISGWGFFGFWVGVWVSSQPRFNIPVLSDLVVTIPISGFTVPVIHVFLGLALVLVGAWFGMAGVKEITLKVAETHRTERVVKTGVYSTVRHPQYLGGIVSHLGITLLLCAWYALLATPLIVSLNYAVSWKEEKELVREFGNEYREYQSNVPMMVPRIHGHRAGR